MKLHLRPLTILLFLSCVLARLFINCVTPTKQHSASSVVDFLYPDTEEPVIAMGTPVLKLPLRVGIAFVPSANEEQTNKGLRGSVFPLFKDHLNMQDEQSLTEQTKMGLMEKVAQHFKKYTYIKDIELIPTAYLKSRGGFANLEQIRTMFGVDVIALVSYDQVQFTDESYLSLTYWTVVGAYFVPGEKNDTHTMLDTVVVDIKSRKMLFRAPGIDHTKGKATPVNITEELRADSEKSFTNAAGQMITNLDLQLAHFKEKIKEHPQDYKVEVTKEYKRHYGGGSLDLLWGIPMIALGVAYVLAQKRKIS